MQVPIVGPSADIFNNVSCCFNPDSATADYTMTKTTSNKHYNPLFADTTFFCAVNSATDCTLLQSDTDSIQGW